MISVIIPLFNKASHIQSTLSLAETSLKKAGVEYQIVIVNDGSKDDSALKVKEWIGNDINRSQVSLLLNQENQGVSAARNTGWQNAKYDLIAFLDADDEWLEDHVSEIISLTKDFPAASMYATAWAEVNKDGIKREKSFGRGTENRGILPCFFDAMATGPMVVSSSTVATWKKYLTKTGGFLRGVTHGEDKVAWGKLALLGDVAFSPVVGGIWRKDAENRSDLIAENRLGRGTLAAFLELCVTPALNSERTPQHLIPGLKNCWLVEKARSMGLIEFYYHDTPDKIQKMFYEYQEFENKMPQISNKMHFNP